jgi:hypothetical protein
MRKSLILLAFVMFALPLITLADNDPWEKAEKILEQIKDPEFPDRDYLITKNGGKAGPECSYGQRKIRWQSRQ